MSGLKCEENKRTAATSESHPASPFIFKETHPHSDFLAQGDRGDRGLPDSASQELLSRYRKLVIEKRKGYSYDDLLAGLNELCARRDVLNEEGSLLSTEDQMHNTGLAFQDSWRGPELFNLPKYDNSTSSNQSIEDSASIESDLATIKVFLEKGGNLETVPMGYLEGLKDDFDELDILPESHPIFGYDDNEIDMTLLSNPKKERGEQNILKNEELNAAMATSLVEIVKQYSASNIN